MSWRWVLYPPFTSEDWPVRSDEEIRAAITALEDAKATETDRQRAVGGPGWRAAHAAQLAAETELARVRGEEYAIELDDRVEPRYV